MLVFESSPITGSVFYDFVSSVFFRDEGVVDDIVSIFAVLKGDASSLIALLPSGPAFLWTDILPTP